VCSYLGEREKEREGERERERGVIQHDKKEEID